MSRDRRERCPELRQYAARTASIASDGTASPASRMIVGSPFPVQDRNRSCPSTVNVPLSSLGVEDAWLPEGGCGEGVSVPESTLLPQPKINNSAVAEVTIDAARQRPIAGSGSPCGGVCSSDIEAPRHSRAGSLDRHRATCRSFPKTGPFTGNEC